MNTSTGGEHAALTVAVRNHFIESARVKCALAGAPDHSDPAFAAMAVAGVAFSPPLDPLANAGQIPSIIRAAELIAAAFRTGGKLLLCGNGGSAADCQHMAAEFVSKLQKTDAPRRALPALALTTDTSFLTAYANDVGFDEVFSRQIEAHGRRGDVLVAISTSGTSPNLIRALEAAQGAGLKTIALTGNSGRLGGMADIAIAVPSSTVAHIQEAHLAIEHVICALVERRLYATSRPRDDVESQERFHRRFDHHD